MFLYSTAVFLNLRNRMHLRGWQKFEYEWQIWCG